MSVTVYHIGPSCVQCNQTKKLLTTLGVEFDYIDLREHPDLAETFKTQGFLTAPIVVTETKTWAGFKYDKLQSLAKKVSEVKVEPGAKTCHGIEWMPEDECLGCVGAAEERARLIAYLKDKGILRDSLFYPGLVARKVDGDTDSGWPIIDLPTELGSQK